MCRFKFLFLKQKVILNTVLSAFKYGIIKLHAAQMHDCFWHDNKYCFSCAIMKENNAFVTISQYCNAVEINPLELGEVYKLCKLCKFMYLFG